MEDQVTIALAQFAAISFSGRPHQVPAVLELANRCPYPPVLLEIFQKIFSLFQLEVQQRGRSKPDRSSLTQLAADLSHLLPRLDGTDAISFTKHLITAFDHSDPDVWVLAYKIIRSILFIAGECTILYHYVTLGLFRGDQEFSAACSLCKHLIRETAAFPANFTGWAAEHFWDLSSLARQRSVVIVLGSAKTTGTVLNQIKYLCRSWLHQLDAASAAQQSRHNGSVWNSSTEFSLDVMDEERDPSSVERLTADQQSALRRWIRATLLQVMIKSLSISQQDRLDLTACVDAGGIGSQDVGSRVSRQEQSLELYQAIRVAARFPEWLLDRHQRHGKHDLVIWLQHEVPRIRAATYRLILQLASLSRASSPPAVTRSVRSLLESQVSLSLVTAAACSSTAAVPGESHVTTAQCDAVLALTHGGLFAPQDVFAWAIQQLDSTIQLPCSKHNTQVVASLTKAMVSLSHLDHSLSQPSFAYFFDFGSTPHVPLEYRKTLLRAYSRLGQIALSHADATIPTADPVHSTFPAVLSFSKSRMARPIQLPQSTVECMQFDLLRPWLNHAHAADALTHFDSDADTDTATSVLPQSLLKAVLPWPAYRLCVLILSTPSTPPAWSAIATATLSNLAARTETEPTRTWLKHLLCVSRSATCLDQLASNKPFDHAHQAKTLSDKFGSESCFQSSLIRVDLSVHSILARLSRQWPVDHETMAATLLELALDYEYLSQVFPEMASSSRDTLSARAALCRMLEDQVGSIQGNQEALASVTAPLQTLPAYHFVTEPKWSLNMLITPASTADQPIIVTHGMDVTFHVYGQIMHQTEASMLPSIAEGQLVAVVSQRPLFQSLRRDLTKQRQVSELAQMVDSTNRSDALTSLSVSSLLVFPLALHANTFSKPAAVPYSALNPGASAEQPHVHVTLLVRLKLPTHLSGGWWECGPMASLVVLPRVAFR